MGPVDPGDDVRAGVVEDLVAALEPGEVVEHEVTALAGVLQHRAHGAVGDHDSLSQHVEEGVSNARCCVTEVAGHLSEVTGRRPFPDARDVGWLNDRPRSDPGPDRGADEAVALSWSR